MMYLLIWLGSALELLITRRKPASVGWMLGLGTATGAGSLLGVICLRKGMVLPAAIILRVFDIRVYYFPVLLGGQRLLVACPFFLQ